MDFKANIETRESVEAKAKPYRLLIGRAVS